MSVRSPINVYRIRDTETGREKTVHRNLLLPVNFLYKHDGTALPSQSNLVDSTSDLPDHPDSDTRTAHWVMQSDQQGRAETFGGAGAQSIKGAHGTQLLIGLCSLLICASKWMLLY